MQRHNHVAVWSWPAGDCPVLSLGNLSGMVISS